MSLSCEQYHKIKIGNKSFGSEEFFKYFGSTYQIEIAFKEVLILKYIEI
jgi:hypothetical protein